MLSIIIDNWSASVRGAAAAAPPGPYPKYMLERLAAPGCELKGLPREPSSTLKPLASGRKSLFTPNLNSILFQNFQVNY